MATSYTSDGWYVVRVDTGIGEQYAVVNITKPNNAPASGVATNWNPLDGLSSHYKSLEGPVAATPEDAWAQWRAALPAGHAFNA